MEVKKYIIILVLLILSSCSSGRDNEKIEKMIDILFSQNKEKKVVKITAEKIKNVNYPIIEIKTDGILIQSTFLPMTSRNGYTNWTSGIGHLITMNGAIITKTNGMNAFLNSLEFNDFNPFNNKTNLQKLPKSLSKEYRFLEPTYQEKIIVVNCDLIFEKKENVVVLDNKLNLFKIIEKCYNEQLKFSSLYWMDENGFVWKSKQWLGNKVNAEITVLKTR